MKYDYLIECPDSSICVKYSNTDEKVEENDLLIITDFYCYSSFDAMQNPNKYKKEVFRVYGIHPNISYGQVRMELLGKPEAGKFAMPMYHCINKYELVVKKSKLYPPCIQNI